MSLAMWHQRCGSQKLSHQIHLMLRISDWLVALLNIEGKIFFSLVSSKIEDHLITKNKIINSSIQKGSMAKVQGCWEYVSVVWNDLKSTKVEKTNIATVWLDIANAYGSVPIS